MKTTILRMLMGAVLVSGLSFAGGGKHGARMAQELGLNPDQQTQMKLIMQERKTAMQDARKNNATKAELKALRKTSHDRVAAVLTPEQMTKFQASAKHRKGKHKPKA